MTSKQPTRKERRKNKSNKPAGNDQKNWIMWGGTAIVVIAVAIVAFVAFSPSDDAAPVEESAIVSGGSLIGDPSAPVTLVEFGDFQ